jgi:hypothetical protein
LYASPNIITVKSRRMMGEHVARMGDMRDAYKLLAGHPEGMGTSGKPRRRWEDKIRLDLRETGWEGVDWIHLAEDRDQWRVLVKTVMNLRVL